VEDSSSSFAHERRAQIGPAFVFNPPDETRRTKYDLDMASVALKDRLELEVHPCSDLQAA
jgi:hypothetical protein